MGTKKLRIAALASKYEEIREAAVNLLEYLAMNAGPSADWPLDLIARDEKSRRKINKLLKKLADATE